MQQLRRTGWHSRMFLTSRQETLPLLAPCFVGESEALELGVTWPGVTAPEADYYEDEEEPIVKQHVKGTPAAVEAPNLAFFSTTVVGGHGTGIVIGTGSNTVMGQIASGWRRAGWLLALGSSCSSCRLCCCAPPRSQKGLGSC